MIIVSLFCSCSERTETITKDTLEVYFDGKMTAKMKDKSYFEKKGDIFRLYGSNDKCISIGDTIYTRVETKTSVIIRKFYNESKD